MSYFDRQKRKMLYEQKHNKNSIKEEVLHSKSSATSFKKGQKVSYKDKEYVVKYCADGNCVIEHEDMQEFVPCSDVKLIKDNKLDENIYQVTYSTDGVNYHSNVLVRAETEDQAKKRALDSAKVKPHTDSQIIITKRDQAFVDDYHGKRGMKLIESVDNPYLGEDAIKAVKRTLEVGISLANRYMTLHELDKLIENLQELRQSIFDKNDFLNEDYSGEMPNAPISPEHNGIYTLLNSLVADEIEAIDGYNGALQTILSIDEIDSTIKEDIIKVLTDIAGEENIHIGQLQKIQELVNPQTQLIKDGEEEAQEVISGGAEDNRE